MLGQLGHSLPVNFCLSVPVSDGQLELTRDTGEICG